ncbi:MAG: hypothetical protein JOZ41_20345 [Chloroflexi bacterium]|nr:hypothetical protein [Chloroflexota bacterium]
MMHRELQHVRDSLDLIHRPLNAAILAESTRDVTAYLGRAQAASDQALLELNNALSRSGSNIGRTERSLVQAAANALTQAFGGAEKVFLGANVSEMRQRLLDFKTQVDFADAYLRAALGVET